MDLKRKDIFNYQFLIPAIAYSADSSKYLNNLAKMKRKENPFSLESGAHI
jgi:hypothetical protein